MFGKNSREKARAKGRRTGGASSGYLRSPTPVRVRPDLHSRLRAALRWLLTATIVLSLGLSGARVLEGYLLSESRFFLATDGSGLHLTGPQHLSKQQVREIFESDLGGSIFAVPVEERHRQLLGRPWIRSAAIRRIWPDGLWVHVSERVPIAFARIEAEGNARGEITKLIDRDGVFLDPPVGAHFSLPVISGIAGSMALPDRAARLRLFERLIRELDSNEPPYSALVSEIDVADPGNARAITVHQGEVVELQLGERHFRHRFAVFLKYIESWKKEFEKVQSVDLRFEGQVAIR